TQEGDLNIEHALAQRPLVRNLDLWNNVLEQAKNQVMPPQDAPRPDALQRRRITARLHLEIHEFDYSKIDDPGREPVRRLTHVEYDATVGDLLGVELRLAAKFPADLSGGSGFDNSANTLFLHPSLLERYIGAAESAVRQTLPNQPTSDAHRRARELVFVAEPSKSTSPAMAAEVVLRRFLQRAYRRPATDSEFQRAMRHFQDAAAKGDYFEAAIKQALQTILISPQFLLRVEAAKEGREAYRVNDWELASRLSYFLWASMPDEELFRLAQENKLHDPAVLKAQVRRMLDDPRSDRLGSVFAAQWLGFEHVGTRVRLDPIDNPWCTDSLMDAMRAESAMFFVSLIRENQPVSKLINADYTYLNEELAKHYRLPGVKGDRMRRARLTTANRGGIFGQASLLAVTSFPGRTSPVVRGKWILSEVLGTPPPPPPPNVSGFSERLEDSERLTAKQKLELHRRNPTCNACHREIDPLGFSLEN
ncbi:MAG: DUF1592 domain-containing protein, partial [Planctomycetales bacterium]